MKKKMPTDESLFECVTLVAVAKDTLNGVKRDLPRAEAFVIDLVISDLDKTFQTLNNIYENVSSSDAGMYWIRLRSTSKDQ